MFCELATAPPLHFKVYHCLSVVFHSFVSYYGTFLKTFSPISTYLRTISFSPLGTAPYLQLPSPTYAIAYHPPLESLSKKTSPDNFDDRSWSLDMTVDDQRGARGAVYG